jgi:acetyl esterase
VNPPNNTPQIPLASGIRRFGKILRKLPGTSIATLSLAQIERTQAMKKRNFIITLLSGNVRPGVRWQDVTVPAEGRDITLRVYTPETAASQPRPLILAIHGGGFVLGNLNTADWMASTVCRDLDAVVVSVDYRLAPGHPFPAAVEDCYEALCWAAANAARLGSTAEMLGVMGESAGGNLSAVLCLLARDKGGPTIRHQALIYPAVDFGSDTESRRNYADEVILTRRDEEAFQHHYLGAHGDPQDWRASPLRAPDHRGLPPALVIVAGHDILRDEGVNYAHKLRGAGVPVTLKEYPAMPHGFINFPRFSRDARPAMAEVVKDQREKLVVSKRN